MISFDILRDYMRQHGQSIYILTKNKIIGGATLDKIRENSQGITVDTINKICNYLNCKPSDIMQYVPDQDDQPE